jgi:hypothetical protein
MKTKKLNRKTRSAIRKTKIAAGTYVAPAKPAAKRKKKVISATRQPKLKAFASRPATGKSPAHPLPEFAAVERRPYLAPRRDYFLGSGILKKLPNPLPDGWVLSTDERPGPEFRLAAIKVFRVTDGDYVKLCRYMLRDEVVAEMRAHAERVKKEIAIDDGNARARKELGLLIAKNRRNGQPTRMFYK